MKSFFVDDGSADGTYEALKALHDTDPHVKVVRFARNYGQTPALAAGFDHAKGNVVVAMDGDLQFHAEDLPSLVDKLAEGYDIVSGWRDRSNDPTTRSLPSRTANRIMASISGVQMRDFGSTFKAYRREILQHLNLYGELHRFIRHSPAAMGAHGRSARAVVAANSRSESLWTIAHRAGVPGHDCGEVPVGLFRKTAAAVW